jgi:phage gp45-like
MSSEISKIYKRVQGIMSVGVITNNSTETNGTRTTQVSQYNGAQTIDNVPHIQEYGFASAPLPGCSKIGISISGDKNNLVIIGTNDKKHRPINLAAGDVQLHDSTQAVHLVYGDHIDVIASNAINIIVGGVNVMTITSSGITMNVPLSVMGTIIATGDITAGAVTLETHVHEGVTSGIESTGLPIG